MKTKLIAPCGINCALCGAFRREKNRCPGCLDPKGNSNLKHLSTCSIKFCENMNKTGHKLCSNCDKFPCARIKQLDKRYRTKYHLSVIENLENIKKLGLREFVKQQEKEWTCPKCKKDLICCHSGKCFGCGYMRNGKNEKSRC